MHPATRLQFDRLIDEYRIWRAVPDRERSPAPGWWWGPAMALWALPGDLPRDFAQRLGLPDSATHVAAAQLFLDALAGQIFLPWPEEFPRRYQPMHDDAAAAGSG